MIALEINQRIIENKDWATLLFLICFIVLAVNKSINASQFGDFLNLPFTKKYVTTYRDTSNLFSRFTISLFFIQVISLSFFVQIILSFYGYTTKTNWITFIQIFTSFSIFILIKFYLEKIIATAFNIEEFIDSFNLKKVNYRSYTGLILLPVVIVLFYNNVNSSVLIGATVLILLLISTYFYITTIKNYQNLILRNIFYFILYLCTLEIGPYYFIYYWITKK